MSSSTPAASQVRADLFVIAAPSAAGKTTLIKGLFGFLNGHTRASEARTEPLPEFSVSHTTRTARPDETDGVDYHFVDETEFKRMVEAGEFLEWAEVHGRRYGTARLEVETRLAHGVDVLLDIDVQGVANVKEAYPSCCAVLVLPPSYAELERRIAGRGQDDPESVARRLAVSLWEIERYELFDYVIVNDDIERAGRELAGVITSRRARRDRREERIKAILADFRSALDTNKTPPN